MDFDCLKNCKANVSLAFDQSYEDKNEFEDLQHLFDDSKDHELANISSDDFPSLDDICLQSERSSCGGFLPFGDVASGDADGVIVEGIQENMDVSIYDGEDQQKINQYMMEYSSIPHLMRNTSSSSSCSSTTTAMLVHNVEPLSAFPPLPPSNGYACQISNSSALVCHRGAKMHIKPPPRKRNQKKPNVVRGQWTPEEDR